MHVVHEKCFFKIYLLPEVNASEFLKNGWSLWSVNAKQSCHYVTSYCYNVSIRGAQYSVVRKLSLIQTSIYANSNDKSNVQDPEALASILVLVRKSTY